MERRKRRLRRPRVVAHEGRGGRPEAKCAQELVARLDRQGDLFWGRVVRNEERPHQRRQVPAPALGREHELVVQGTGYGERRVIFFFLYASVSAASVDVATIRQYDLPEPSEANNTRTHAVDATLLGHRTLIITLVIEAAAPPGRTARP